MWVVSEIERGRDDVWGVVGCKSKELHKDEKGKVPVLRCHVYSTVLLVWCDVERLTIISRVGAQVEK